MYRQSGRALAGCAVTALAVVSSLSLGAPASEAATPIADAYVVPTASPRFVADRDNQGYIYADTGGFWRGTPRSPGNYEVGYYNDCEGGYSWTSRNYFSFDLSDLPPGSAERARLVVRRGHTVHGGTLQLNEVTTPADDLHLSGYEVTQALYRDLGDGPVYGQYSLTEGAEQDDWVRLRLNRHAVARINDAAGGWFTISGSLIESPGPGCGLHALFQGTSNEGAQRLVILGTRG